MAPNTIWTDHEALAPTLGQVGAVGFLVEHYRPGKGSSHELRAEPMTDYRSGRPALEADGQPWNNVHPYGRGLYRVARYAKSTLRVCLSRVPAADVATALEGLGYPELIPDEDATTDQERRLGQELASALDRAGYRIVANGQGPATAAELAEVYRIARDVVDAARP